MACQKDKEANPITSVTNGSVLPRIHVNANGNVDHGHSPAPRPQKTQKEQQTADKKLADILLTFTKQPLIPNETALTLLKIQSKFVSSHPCLCTSRFRHTLHQLDEEHHQDLDRLCNQLSRILKLKDEREEKKNLFASVVPCIFGDIGSLEQKCNEWLVRSGQQDQSCKEELCLNKQLQGIIGRLVTDYRAIFAIEVEFSRSFEKSDEELHAIDLHRKRHEEVDECPEEIKLMKVAEELTLECTATTTDPSLIKNAENHVSGPKFCLKSLTSQEEPEKDNSIHRHPANNSPNAALEDVRSRQQHHHHRRSHHHYVHHATSREEKAVTSLKVVQHENDALASAASAAAVALSTDSTPVSSDVEHSQTPSPRRSCQRKRKERRDSIGEAQDKKFSKSSSDVFPCDKDSASEVSCVRRVQSTIDFATNKTSEDCCLGQKHNLDDQKGKCTFYVSDDEAPELPQDVVKNGCEKAQKRAIMRPRRSRKVRTDSLKENEHNGLIQEEQTSLAKEESSSSPVLPWKKNVTLSPPTLSTQPPISTSSAVLGLVVAVKSSIVQDQEDNEDKDSDSSSSSTSDETLSNVDVDDTDSGINTIFNTKNMNPVQDSQHQSYQPVAWEPYGALWKSELDLENEETRDEFQSTRHFGIINSKQHLDRNHYGSRETNQESKSKVKQLSKQLHLVKKKVEEFEIKFEEAHGYKPSQAEKQSNKEIRKLILQQSRLKRQIRICRESGDSGINLEDYNSSPAMSPTRPWSPACSEFADLLAVYSDNSNDSNSNNNNIERLKSVVQDIEEKLDEERVAAGRPEALEDMSAEQVIQEKNSIQVALNQVQDVLNTHKTTDEERFVLKDLLMRYRSVKRMVRRTGNLLIKDHCELETIPEGAEIQLTLASPQSRINIEMNATSNSRATLDQADIPKKLTATMANNSLPNDVQENELNLHAMSRNELLNVQRAAREEKKLLRRTLKEREVKFLEVNGRPMPKDELKEQEYYFKYKMTKAKLKLVDALLSKSGKQ